MGKDNEILLNEPLLRNVVWAIVKANGEDIQAFLQNDRLETNNSLPMRKNDYINDNLRSFVTNDKIKLIPFKRFSWAGRVLFDSTNHTTYTITTFTTLKSVTRKRNRTYPHYLNSILAAENSDCQASAKQLSLIGFGPQPFAEEELRADYLNIMGQYSEDLESCHHYIVAYAAERGNVQNIEILLLDKDFDVVARNSLNDYIKPDFGQLTEPSNIGSHDKAENIHGFINVKEGIKPKLRDGEEQA